MKKQKSHRNSREFRDFYRKGKFYCTSSTIWGDKDKNNMHYCNYEVIKKRLLSLSLLLLKAMKFILEKNHRHQRNKKIIVV